MDPNDFFRNFWSFGRPRGPREGDIDSHTRDMDDMFSHFHDDMRRQMEDMNRQMEDMFRNFGSIDFHQDQYSRPAIEYYSDNPRNRMLKEPEKPVDVPAIRRNDEHNNPFGRLFSTPRFDLFRRGSRRDVDLDEEIDERSVHKLFEESRQDGNEPRVFSSSKSFSMSRIQRPDGKMEERRKIRHSDGTEEDVITRHYNDQSHTVTTKINKEGRVERNEVLNNMDEKDLPEFQRKWNNTNQDALRPPNPRDELIPFDDQHRSIFDRFFGPRY